MEYDFEFDIKLINEIMAELIQTLATIKGNTRDALPAVACLLGNLYYASYNDMLPKEVYEEGFKRLSDVAKAYAAIEVKNE